MELMYEASMHGIIQLTIWLLHTRKARWRGKYWLLFVCHFPPNIPVQQLWSVAPCNENLRLFPWEAVQVLPIREWNAWDSVFRSQPYFTWLWSAEDTWSLKGRMVLENLSSSVVFSSGLEESRMTQIAFKSKFKLPQKTRKRLGGCGIKRSRDAYTLQAQIQKRLQQGTGN